jgi:hypothetical protein
MSAPHVAYFYDQDVGNFHYGTVSIKNTRAARVCLLATGCKVAGRSCLDADILSFFVELLRSLLRSLPSLRCEPPDETAQAGIDTRLGAKLWTLQEDGCELYDLVAQLMQERSVPILDAHRIFVFIFFAFQVYRPYRACAEDMTTFHTPDYIDFLQRFVA